MTCFSPMYLYKAIGGGMTKSPARAINPLASPIMIPCGKCVGCRLKKSSEWAMRCQLEASCYEQNCFLTLTFAPDRIPDEFKTADGKLTLSKEWAKAFFNKRFREAIRYKFNKEIRYFLCGEYGEKFERPHFHVIIFGFDFEDKKYFKGRGYNRIYTSEALQSLWPFGHSSVGNVSFESCAYVARYVMKKITGDMAESHYDGREPEFTLMSLRPGIGAPWFKKYMSDVFPNDYLMIRRKNGIFKVKPPRLFDMWFEKDHQELMNAIRLERSREGVKRLIEKEMYDFIHHYDELKIHDELVVQESIKKDQIRTLHRKLEKDVV